MPGPNSGLDQVLRSADETPSCTARPLEQVLAFYNASLHSEGRRYVYGAQEQDIGRFPLVGLTCGWLPAAVVHQDAKDGRALVRFPGPFCDPFDVAPPPAAAQTIRRMAAAQARQRSASTPLRLPGGTTLQPPGAAFAHPEQAVHAAAAAFGCGKDRLSAQALFGERLRELPNDAAGKLQLQVELSMSSQLVRRPGERAPARPVVSVVCLRWYDYWSEPHESSDYNTLNDGMFLDLLEGPCSLGRQLPGEYEVYTIFVRESSDLRKLDPQGLRALLRGESTVAWYFVWPSVDGAGFVSEQEFFALCQAMERVPIRSGWPHASHLYRILCGKLWVPQLCLHRDYQVPPTTRVHLAEFKQNCRKAVARALRWLVRLRVRVWGCETLPLEEFRGVVKLGFSWGGQDVLPFQGPDCCIRQLRQLFSHQRNLNTACLVQEMVPGIVAEHRVLCFHDRLGRGFRREAVWNACGGSSFGIAGFRLTTPTVVPDAEVAARFFNGDRAAQRSAEVEAQRLVGRWLRWFSTEGPDPPQCTRIDFLVSRTEGSGPVLWTCEVGECGASLCSVEVHGRNAAVVNTAVLRDRFGRFPSALPEAIPRNDGSKS